MQVMTCYLWKCCYSLIYQFIVKNMHGSIRTNLFVNIRGVYIKIMSVSWLLSPTPALIQWYLPAPLPSPDAAAASDDQIALPRAPSRHPPDAATPHRPLCHHETTNNNLTIIGKLLKWRSTCSVPLILVQCMIGSMYIDWNWLYGFAMNMLKICFIYQTWEIIAYACTLQLFIIFVNRGLQLTVNLMFLSEIK